MGLKPPRREFESLHSHNNGPVAQFGSSSALITQRSVIRVHPGPLEQIKLIECIDTQARISRDIIFKQIDGIRVRLPTI